MYDDTIEKQIKKYCVGIFVLLSYFDKLLLFEYLRYFISFIP